MEENKYQFAREIIFNLRSYQAIDGKVYMHWVDKLNTEEEAELTNPITPQILIDFGFTKDINGNHCIDAQTHRLELIQSGEHWYPVYVQLPEMSHEDEQRVGIHRIEFVYELKNVFLVLTGENLEIKQS